jgi:hypothetical protein
MAACSSGAAVKIDSGESRDRMLFNGRVRLTEKTG